MAATTSDPLVDEETARRLGIMPEYDEIDRQSLGIRDDLVERIAGRQIPLGDHPTRLQPLERPIQQLSITSRIVHQARVAGGARNDRGIRDAV